jgi:hypothetical protein
LSLQTKQIPVKQRKKRRQEKKSIIYHIIFRFVLLPKSFNVVAKINAFIYIYKFIRN